MFKKEIQQVERLFWTQRQHTLARYSHCDSTLLINGNSASPIVPYLQDTGRGAGLYSLRRDPWLCRFAIVTSRGS